MTQPSRCTGAKPLSLPGNSLILISSATTVVVCMGVRYRSVRSGRDARATLLSAALRSIEQSALPHDPRRMQDHRPESSGEVLKSTRRGNSLQDPLESTALMAPHTLAMKAPDLDDAPPKAQIWVMPIKAVFALTVFESHEELLKRGVLVEWSPGMGDILFLSHTWLRYLHPDGPSGEKLALLKELIHKLISAKSGDDIHPNWLVELAGLSKVKIKATELAQSIDTGYLWMDIASIPQDNPELKIRGINAIPECIAAARWLALGTMLQGYGRTRQLYCRDGSHFTRTSHQADDPREGGTYD